MYGFPILMIVGLGIAFRNQPAEHVIVDVESGQQAAGIVKALSADPRFQIKTCDAAECRVRLRTGKTQLVVSAAGSPVTYQYEFDPSRPENVVARESVNNALQRVPAASIRSKRATRSSTNRAAVTSISSSPDCSA